MTVISSALKPTCSDGVSQIAFYVTIAALVGKILPTKLYFLLQFRTVNINCSASVENSPTGLPKCINSACPSESFWQKLPKKCSFPISFGSWTNSFRSFAEEFSGVVKFGFYLCPGTYRGNLHCFEKNYHCLSFLHIEGRSPALLARYFCLGCQNCFLSVHRNIFRTILQKKFKRLSILFQTLSWKNGLPSNISAGVVKTAFSVSRGKSTSLGKKTFSTNFGNSTENFRLTVKNVLSRDVKTASYVSIEKISGEVLCFEKNKFF